MTDCASEVPGNVCTGDYAGGFGRACAAQSACIADNPHVRNRAAAMLVAFRHEMAKPLIEAMAAPDGPRDFIGWQEAVAETNNVRIKGFFGAGGRIPLLVDFGNPGVLDGIASFNPYDGMAIERRHAGAPEYVLVGDARRAPGPVR